MASSIELLEQAHEAMLEAIKAHSKKANPDSMEMKALRAMAANWGSLTNSFANRERMDDYKNERAS